MAITDEGLARIAAAGLRPEQLPRHVAIIMDGNGRWAQRRGLPRIVGHRRGIQSVRAVVEEGCRLGLDQLTLYCLSVENWKRPPRELTFLMRLLRHFLVVERDELMEQNVRAHDDRPARGPAAGRARRVRADGRADRLRTTGMTLCLAVNYGGRTEIGDAARRLAEDVQAGRVEPDQVDESALRLVSLHRRDERSRPADPHGGRDADQQLPALADLVRRALGHADALARLPRRRPARRPAAPSPPASASSAACPPSRPGTPLADPRSARTAIDRPSLRSIVRDPGSAESDFGLRRIRGRLIRARSIEP